MSLPSYMRPEQPRGTGDIPTFQIGQLVEAKIDSIEETTGNYGKQLQFNLTLPNHGNFSAKAWVKYYPVPAPHQHLGKLCLAVERVTGQSFSSLGAALDALKNYGRVYVKAKQSKTVTGDDGKERTFPRFSIAPDTLPGELGTPATPPPPPQLQQAPKPNLVANVLTTETKLWLQVSQSDIGQVIDDMTWNLMVNKGIAKELMKYDLIEMRDGYPVLSEKCREYL